MTQTPPISAEQVEDLRRSAKSLLDALWQQVYSGARTFEENWAEMERRFPQSKWLHEALAAASIPARGVETPKPDQDEFPHPTPWYWEDWSGDVLDANGHLIFSSVFNQSSAELVVRCVNAASASPAPQPVEEQEPFATAWQTSYTGDQWHFDRKVSFAPADIERGIVRNITPLAALVKP